MATLKEQIDQDIKEAMRAKETDRLRALRAIKSMIMLEETREGAPAGQPLSPEDERRILQKALKQRRDSIEIFEAQGRQDLAAPEQAELAVIQGYLPPPLSEAELRQTIANLIEQMAGHGAKPAMGQVIGQAQKDLAGRAEGRQIAAIVKELLMQG